MKRILLVEDEANLVSFIRKGLTEAGYSITVAPDGISGLAMALEHSFDLLLLDIMLPGMSGLELCRLFREKDRSTPVLILTALGTTENIVLGLEQGADDYLVKPFKLIELLARVKSLLRRSAISVTGPGSVQEEGLYVLADLQLDDRAKTVMRNGRIIPLTSTEYRLLLTFLQNRGHVLSRIDLLSKVWDIDFNMGTNVVDVYVNYLRKKIDKDHQQKLIHTVVGMGYVLKESYENAN